MDALPAPNELTVPSAIRPDGTSLPSPRLVPPDHSYVEPLSGHGSGIAHMLTSPEGYIVGRLENKLLRLNTDSHILTVAPTRSGKGVSCVIPNLLDHPGSAFVIDIRGDTVARTADARLLMGQDVVVLDPFHRTEGRWGYDSFNPLDFLENPGTPDFDARVKRFVEAMLFDPGGRASKEPIWDNATTLALSGAIFYIKTCLPPERQTLKELSRLLTLVPEQRAAMAEEIVRTAHASNTAYMGKIDRFVEFITYGGEKTKIPDNTVVQAMTLLDWVTDTGFSPIVDRSTFSFADLQKKPTTVYLVLPEEHIKGCEIWVRLLFNAALFSLEETNRAFGRPSNALRAAERVLFLLDEFPQFGRLQPVEDGIATVAGRGATLWLFIQSMAQLERIYTPEGARQIVGNAALLQAFNANEIHELEYFSRVVGKELFDVQSVTVTATATTGGSEGTSRTLTIGNTESFTEGTSHSTAIGESHSVSDGTSTSIGRSVGTGTSTSVGTSRSAQHSSGSSSGTSDNVSRSRGSNQGSGGGTNRQSGGGSGTSGNYTALDYIGMDLPLWNTKNRNQNWGEGSSRNWSQGISDSLTRSSGRSFSRNVSDSVGTTRSHTNTRSRNVTDSRTDTKSHTETHTTSRTETSGTHESRSTGTSKSEAVGTTEGKTWSDAKSHGYTVKAEVREVETPRSLRRSMSHGAQLLVLRGFNPFLAPRLTYFERWTENVDQARVVTRFRFPEMALLAGVTTPEELWETMVEPSLYQFHLNGFLLEWAPEFMTERLQEIFASPAPETPALLKHLDSLLQVRKMFLRADHVNEKILESQDGVMPFVSLLEHYAQCPSDIIPQTINRSALDEVFASAAKLRDSLLLQEDYSTELAQALERRSITASDIGWLMAQYRPLMEAGVRDAHRLSETEQRFIAQHEALRAAIIAFAKTASLHTASLLESAALRQIERRNGSGLHRTMAVPETP